MVSDRRTLVLYSTSVCNLSCSYCFIDKNPVLVQIDKKLAESFNGDYYFDFAKEVFPDRNQLVEIQVWGGEPFLSMDRVLPTIKKLLDYYPNCDRLMVSTNFVSPHFIQQYKGLLDVLENAGRKVTFASQLSLDGPKHFTDVGRGEGTTDKFVKRWVEYLNFLKTESCSWENLKLQIMFKPTLDSVSIKKLQSLEAVLDYYQFFEGLHAEFLSKNFGDNVTCNLPIPNTACPSPHDKEDGVLFANYCRICRDIENSGTLKYYSRVTPFPRRKGLNVDDVNYGLAGGVCGSGRSMVGLLPDRMISECHMSFVDYLGSFKEALADKKEGTTTLDSNFFKPKKFTPLTLSYEELESYERNVALFYNQGSQARLVNMAAQIRIEALVGNIESKYQDEAESIKAARFLTDSTAYCVRDNLNVGGSLCTYPVGLIRLLLNGAKEYTE